MKFTVTVRVDTDYSYDTAYDGPDITFIAENTGIPEGELWDLLDRSIPTEITYQFDTADRSCRVLGEDEEGVNDWLPVKKHEEILTQQQIEEETTRELKRQLNEALVALSQETDLSTPYAQGLLKFVMETRSDLKFWEQGMEP